MRIGSLVLDGNLWVAPMAGVSDRPFRALCRRYGAALAPGEMISAEARLWATAKTRARLEHAGEPHPWAVQIAGAEPRSLAEAARACVGRGAELVDVNLGCPARKVCRRSAGSALLADEALVGRILEAVVAAVAVPVTVKIRTGVSPERRNGVAVARLAEAAGVAAITVHGRTRACGFHGPCELRTARAIRRAVAIPVIANGDITGPEEARAALEASGADGVMIGRAAWGRPWLFRAVRRYLESGERLPEPGPAEVGALVAEHLEAIYGLYGEQRGVRVARKHLRRYLAGRPGGEAAWAGLCRLDTARGQLARINDYFAALAGGDLAEAA